MPQDRPGDFLRTPAPRLRVVAPERPGAILGLAGVALLAGLLQ